MPEGRSVKKKYTVRTCAVCGSKKYKDEMVRLVRSSGGSVKIDLSGKVSGRGAYVCSKECWFRHDVPGKVARSLRLSVGDLDWDSLVEEYDPI